MWKKLLSCEIAGFVERNTVSYSAAISACEKAGNWSVMLLLLEEMHLVYKSGSCRVIG